MAEIGVAQEIDTAAGNVVFNTGDPGELRVTSITGLEGTSNTRSPVDKVPQADGMYPHRFFRDARYPIINGVVMPTTSISGRQAAIDDMLGKLDSIWQADGRYLWTPSNAAQRFIVVRSWGEVTVTDDSSNPFVKNFSIPLIAPDPTIYTAAETDTQIVPGTPATITNAGNRKSFPVIEIAPGSNPGYSGTTVTGFTLTNQTTGLTVVAGDHSAFTSLLLPLSITTGNFAELVMGPIRQTFYSNGDQANLLGAISMVESDFWYLQPGDNVITVSGAHAYVKSNDGWA
ncbi:MAG TPA: hypothetical protein VG265_15475 [Gaiellaceae bacterium]|jgi:phage-related protein|nr:hypothetical protein [Gaiellaceae bacterium]